jgi:pyruvate dehydrogenase E2 component (dihydrolipoamide acetyltransferase)
MSKEFRLQDPGEGIHEAEIVDLYIKPGDRVKEGDTLLDVETDKAVAEVPSPFTGTIDEVRVNKGDVATVGDVLFTYTGEGEAEGEERSGKEESKEEKEEKGEKKKPEFDLARDLEQAMNREPGEKEKGEEEPARRRGAPVPAAPATRRLARELGVELAQVTPGGPHGRVTDEDVRSFAEQGKGKAKAPPKKGTEKPAPAEGGFEQWGAVESVPFRGVRRKIAEHLAAAWAGVPHVTHRSLVDITELEALRRRHKGEVEAAGGKLTATIFAIKAAVAALKRFPRFNASLDEAGENLVLKHYYHIGVAVDTDEGLLVPVIRDADRKDMFELAAELGALAERARAGKLELEEMRGGSFSITNPGMLGGTGFTPLINTPEVAILGLAQARLEPVVQGTLEEYTIVPRLMLPLCLAFDHRVNDGADAARFVNAIAEALADPEELMLKG